MELPTAHDFFRIPFLENVIDDFFDVIEIGFGFDRIVNAIVSGEKNFAIVHFRIVAKMRKTSGLD